MNRPYRALPFCALLFLLVPGFATPVSAQTTEIRPVDFLLTGTVLEDGSGAPVDRARVIVERQDDGTVLADRVFTDGSGQYSVLFEAEVEVTVGLGDDGIDPDQPRETSFGGRWMGKMWPNPVVGEGNVRLTLPYASPEKSAAEPELQLFDMRGRRVSDDETLAAGVYFYRLRFGDRFVPARKLVVVQPTRPQVDLVPMKSVSSASDEAPDGLSKRVDGQANVVVRVLRPGYVPEAIPWTVESEQTNTVDASLVVEPAPTAALQVGGTLEAGQAVTFDGGTSVAADGESLDFSWDFGDGQLGGAQQVSHVYAAAGTYDVVLTVTGTHGATDSATTQITVAAPPEPVTSDAQVVGSITDVAGNLLEGVVGTIVGTSVADTSLVDGSLTLDGVPTGIPLSVRLHKDGYAEQMVRITLPDSTEFTSFESTLTLRRSAVTLPRIEDGEFCRGEDGATVDLPPDALLRPDGSPATGEARLSLTPLDMSNERESFAFPGGYEGIQPTGDRGLILSYGVMEVVFEQGGEELQLAPGRSAGVEIPLYSANATVGDVIGLWSVDPNTGLWRQEGDGTVVANADSPTGLALEAVVSHFSWWNADVFDEAPYRPIPRCKIKDENGLPTLDIPSGGACYINGQVQGGGGPWGNPDTNVPPSGGVAVPVPANTDFLLQASAANGSQRGSVVVNGPSDVTEVITIILDPVGAGGGALILPAQEEGSIDPAGEVDVYTFDASVGQRVNVSAQAILGGTLEGTVRLLDPNGTVVDSLTFRGDTPGGLAHEIALSGEWSVEVDGTANEPGGYELDVRFVSVIDFTPSASFEIETVPGTIQPLRFEAQAGDYVSIDTRRLEGSGGRGSVRIFAPDGSEVFDRSFSFSFRNLGLLALEQTGTYEIEFFSRDLLGTSVLAVRDVTDIGLGQTREGSLEENSVRYYRIPSGTGESVNAALDEIDSFRGSVGVVNEQDQSASTQLNLGTNVSSGVQTLPDDGPWFLRVGTSFTTRDRSLRSYRVRLDEVRPPATLIFDSFGRAEASLPIDRFGQLRLVQFDAAVGDGVWIELQEGASSSPGTGVTMELYRVGGGELLNPASRVFSTSTYNGDTSSGILEALGVRLTETDTYVLLVGSRNTNVGDITLRLDRVGSSAAITVDDDLVECPDADTRSLQAALAAVEANGLVNVCEGDYLSPLSFQTETGPVTIEGAGRTLTTLATEGSGAVLTVGDGLVAVRDLALEARGTSQATGIQVFNAQGTVFERIDARAVTGTPSMDVAFDLSSVDAPIVRDCTAERTFRAVEARRCDGIVIEDNVFTQSMAQVDIQDSDQAIIQRNQFDCTEVGEVISFSNAAGGQILDNDVTIATPDVGARLNTDAFSIDDEDVLGTLPPTVVRGNRVVTNEACLSSQVRAGSSRVEIENNVFIMTNSFGRQAMDLIGASNQTGMSFLVRNNVFEGVRLFEGIRFFNTERLDELQFVNNSFRVAPGTNAQASYSLFEIEVGDAAFTGALPVTMANNVFAGVDAGIAVTLPVGVTIDGNWNLFDGFPTLYDGGSTSSGTDDLVDVDPLFADDELRLQAASPAVDSGASQAQVASVPDTDVEGTVRPQGAGVDRGAYER